MTTSNTYSISVPAGSIATFHAMGKMGTSPEMRATVNWLENTVVVTATASGPLLSETGQDVFMLSAEPEDFVIKVTLEWAEQSVNGPYVPIPGQKFTQTDKDGFNVSEIIAGRPGNPADWFINFTVVTTSSDSNSSSSNGFVSEGAAVSDAVVFAPDPKKLELHAKTYYNNPEIEGGDEHFIGVPIDAHGDAGCTYASTGWSLDRSNCWFEESALGGYVHVMIDANDCRHPGMEGANLRLWTVFGYWFSRPTGWSSVSWNGKMTNTQYKIVRITN